MRFILVVPVIVHPDQQDFPRVAFQRLGVLSVLDLLYGSAGGLVVFQLNHQRRLFTEGRCSLPD